MTDSAVKEEIECAFESKPAIGAHRIDVSVDRGVVTLRGTVDSYLARAIAETIALRHSGSKAVTNSLEV